MATATMPPATARFVEQMGLLLEAERLPRISGRILGLLLATDGPLSLDEIAGTLDVSKASISTNARLLADKGVIERTSLAGDRRDLYEAAADMPFKMLRARVERMQRVREVLADGRDTITTRSRPVRDRLDDMVTSYDLFIESMHRSLEHLPARLNARRAERGRQK